MFVLYDTRNTRSRTAQCVKHTLAIFTVHICRKTYVRDDHLRYLRTVFTEYYPYEIIIIIAVVVVVLVVVVTISRTIRGDRRGHACEFPFTRY